jgi:ferrochelatase
MSKKVILLTNLGSPDSYEVKDLRKYLTQFLMDGRVIDVPYLLRTLLVRGIIVPFRSPKSAAKYKRIWTEDGSPLIQSTKVLSRIIEDMSEMPTYYCMRYGNPSPQDVLREIKQKHTDIAEIILVPMYPHYAMSSYETGVEYVKECFQDFFANVQLRIIQPFYNDESYIDSLYISMKPFVDNGFDHVLFSYHGLPVRHLEKSDPTNAHCNKIKNCCEVLSAAHKFCYKHQVTVTTKLITEKLNIPMDKYSISFQSRLAGDKWISPYTDELLKMLPKQGVKKLLVVCPAFVSDCLETLEEIHMEGKEIFLESGGDDLIPIPCLNANPYWAEALCRIIAKNT